MSQLFTCAALNAGRVAIRIAYSITGAWLARLILSDCHL